MVWGGYASDQPSVIDEFQHIELLVLASFDSDIALEMPPSSKTELNQPDNRFASP